MDLVGIKTFESVGSILEISYPKNRLWCCCFGFWDILWFGVCFVVFCCFLSMKGLTLFFCHENNKDLTTLDDLVT